MQINWFTVIAQLFNFILLVWLMKRFLYKPIMAAIDEREKKIKAQLNDTTAQKAEAQKEQEAFSAKNADFDQHKKASMDAAITDSRTEWQKLLDLARTDAEALRTNYSRSPGRNADYYANRFGQKDPASGSFQAQPDPKTT